MTHNIEKIVETKDYRLEIRALWKKFGLLNTKKQGFLKL